MIASEVGESPRNIQRYIRLTELIPDLLELVDKKKLPFTIAVEISYIDKKIQQWLYEYIRDNGFIKPKQISALREHLKTETNDYSSKRKYAREKIRKKSNSIGRQIIEIFSTILFAG